jgi:hypothetical protein
VITTTPRPAFFVFTLQPIKIACFIVIPRRAAFIDRGREYWSGSMCERCNPRP